jgi:hypothetical protein
LELLKNFGVYYWPRFSSTSKNKNCVEEEGKRILFEIYMSETDCGEGVPTSIDIS